MGMSHDFPSKLILLQDNAAAHRKREFLTAIEKFGWEIMAHSPLLAEFVALGPFPFLLDQGDHAWAMIQGRRGHQRELQAVTLCCDGVRFTPWHRRSRSPPEEMHRS